MMVLYEELSLKTPFRYGIWLVGVSFVLFQFFLQLSSGVIIGAIMQEMHLSAFKAGLLSSAFYYIYTALQIPVGVLFDRKSTRSLLVTTAFVCSVGCIFFAYSQNFTLLFLSRFLIGGGSAFAFVGLSHLLRQHFPLKQFGFMIGLSETLGFLITVLGIISMASLIAEWGWRNFISYVGILGFFISYLCWRYIPVTKTPPFTPSKKQLLLIIKNKKTWINGIFVGLSFTVITVLGAMWAVPFIQVKLGCSLKEASIIDSMIFLGAAISCPLFGLLANLYRRRWLMVFSCLSTAFLILLLLYLPINNHLMLAFLMLLIGISCGAYMLAFSIANELAPAEALSTCTGFTNSLAMITAPLLQLLIGFLLNCASPGNHYYSLSDYQTVLLTIPLSLLLASGLCFLLP